MKLSDIKIGETFKIGDIEFIKLSDRMVITRNILFVSSFGQTNNLDDSIIIHKLIQDFLPKIEKIVEKNNILSFNTDLLSIDGSSGSWTRGYVSLLSLDQYRRYKRILDKYPVPEAWWLATPGNYSYFCCGVYRGGQVNLSYDVKYNNNGVRPVLTLNPDTYINPLSEFAEEIKTMFYKEFDELIPSIIADKIDELVEKKMHEISK